jgi:hypothetical protein
MISNGKKVDANKTNPAPERPLSQFYYAGLLSRKSVVALTGLYYIRLWPFGLLTHNYHQFFHSRNVLFQSVWLHVCTKGHSASDMLFFRRGWDECQSCVRPIRLFADCLRSLRLAPGDAAGLGYHHGLIKRISSSPNGIPQIVITNFDLLFEIGDDAAFHVPPAFPDLTFGKPH